MKKSIIKKLFIKLSKVLGYEIIDQSDFSSPTLQKELNEDLSIINEKSINIILANETAGPTIIDVGIKENNKRKIKIKNFFKNINLFLY